MPCTHVHPLVKWSSLAAKPASILVAALIAFSLPAQAAAWLSQSKTTQPRPAPMPRGERHESKHEIDQMEETWRTAALNHDAAAMNALLSEDYIGITAGGTLQSKAETVAGMRAGTLQFKRLDLSDRKVRFYGQTALVTSRAEVEGVGANGPISGSFRYTRVYARDSQGKWKIVSFEASRIREDGERR